MDGFSIFHGGDNIRVNTSDDDEEELERHKSIEKGLNDFLGNDLLELDETESSIGHSRMYDGHHHQQQDHNPFYGQHQPVPANVNSYLPYGKNDRNHNNHFNSGHRHSGSNDIGRLNDALESKTREVDHINGLLLMEKRRSDELEKRCKLSEAEKERAFMQKQQFHDLLVEQKGRSTALEEDISNFKSKIKNLEAGNTKLVCELESTKTMLADCELKYRIIEKDAHTSRHVDGILKQENDRHTAQAYMMQQELSSLRNKLDDKELEVKNLHARYKELQKSRAAIVEEHSGVTSQMRRDIDEFQRSTANTSQENLTLKKRVQSLEQENSELQQTIHQLTLRCDKSKSRNNSTDRVINSTNPDESLDYFKKNRSSIVGSTPINTNDEINRLKKELDRCTTALTASKCELDEMAKQLQSKSDENRQLKDDENNALVELARYKEECQRLTGKLSLLDSELKYGDALEHQKKRLEEFQDQIDDLQRVNDDTADECAQLRSCNAKLIEEKARCCEMNEELKRQLVSDTDTLKCDRDKLNGQLLQIQREHQELKNKYVEVTATNERINDELIRLRQSENLRKSVSTNCTQCIDNKTLITKLEVENVELQNACSNHRREIVELKQSIQNLNNVVELKREYDVMLNELKVQAKEFSELVQTHNTTAKNAPSNTPRPIESRDQSVSTTPDLDYHSEPATRREIEMKMSQIMSAKIKRLESDALAQRQEIYRNVERLTGELEKAHADVKMREKEVELLKLTLLAERKASGERLAKIQVDLNANSQAVWTKLCHENDELKRELQEKCLIENAERESVAILKKQWQDTETSLLMDIKNLKNVIGDFETEKSQIIKRLNKKYESAVKRGDNYRDYADAKEQHILSESARIREEYHNKLSKMQTKYLEKLDTILKDKEKEHTDRIIKLEEEWRARLENYQADYGSK